MLKKSHIAMLLTILVASSAFAESADDVWKKEMERKIDVLSRELEKKEHKSIVPKIEGSKHGLAPAASKVYNVDQGVSFGGYGEMTYTDSASQKDNGTASGVKDELDFLRAIIYMGYKFSPKIIFNSEIEFEHATTSNSGSRGEVSVEFAALDFLMHPQANVRAGMLLVPVGLTNEMHEPTMFHGVQRPSTEKRIIPSTWRENGVGLFGNGAGFEYRTYVMAGLQGVNNTGDGFGGFSSNGIRDGRSKGAKSQVEDKAWVARADYEKIPGTRIGGSYYIGNSGQDTLNAAGEEIDGTVQIYEVHGQTELKGFELTGLYAKGTVDNAAELNAAQSTPLTGSSSIGEEMFGGYIVAAFNVLSLTSCTQYLAPFVRYERYDTQQEVPTGFTSNPALSRTEYTFGLTYKPHPNVVIKADYQNQKNQADTGIDSFNAGLGYVF